MDEETPTETPIEERVQYLFDEFTHLRSWVYKRDADRNEREQRRLYLFGIAVYCFLIGWALGKGPVR